MVTEEMTLIRVEQGRQSWIGWIIYDLECRAKRVNYFLEAMGI